MKYVVISFDDNTIYDRKAVEILNKHRLKGTFFINSGTVGKEGYITRDDLKNLYTRHEIGSHTINHLNLKDLSKEEMEYQIREDIEFLESYSDHEVNGFNYPFGDYNKRTIAALKKYGIKYARTVKGTKEFDTPKDFYIWHPTMHFSGLAWDTNDRERRNRGVEFMFDKLEEFFGDEDAPLFHVWLHTWELKDDLYKWDQFERLCRILTMEDVEVVTMNEYYNIMK